MTGWILRPIILDLTPDQAATNIPATIGVAGGTFFGNLISASFIGDFSRAATALHLPMPARYALSLAANDVATLLPTILIVRLLVRGIPFVP